MDVINKEPLGCVSIPSVYIDLGTACASISLTLSLVSLVLQSSLMKALHKICGTTLMGKNHDYFLHCQGSRTLLDMFYKDNPKFLGHLQL